MTGGLADYDPRAADIYSIYWGPEISRLVQTMTRDRVVTWELEPVSEDCKRDKLCKSYLIAGPYQTITPWPFIEGTESGVGFRMYNAPFVQVETWDTGDGLMFNETRDCELYGGVNRTSEFSSLLCMSQENTEGPIAAGTL